YGTYFTVPERNDLIRFLGENGFNFYLYGPKNDRQHRMRWSEPYPAAIMEDFARSIRLAREGGVTFCYAISFGAALDHASAGGFDRITAKLLGFYQRGCRSFAVFLDDFPLEDIRPSGRSDSPSGQSGSPSGVSGSPSGGPSSRLDIRAVAEADAALCNRLHGWLATLDETCSLSMVPTEYSGRPPFGEYLHRLGAALGTGIEVLYTGPEVCSPAIGVADVEDFSRVVGRPPLIWDNYPVNDGLMRPEMHVGPLRGRDPSLPSVCKGFVSNLMNQKEASKIALLTVAEYLRDPAGYDPEAAWTRALALVGQESHEALRRFAENSLHSCLQEEEAPRMSALMSMALESLERGEWPGSSPAAAALRAYLDLLDESCYELKNRMRNLALRQNLLPWIEDLEARLWLARAALQALERLDEGLDAAPALRTMEELLVEVRKDPRRIGGTGPLELAAYARRRAVDAGVAAPGSGPAAAVPLGQIASGGGGWP
ncbi:MAG: beta-N-acetylglucosaminidase domain-containing protein, partial [Chloroflexi bacterium]|nr:beta-N-acetylglucosaminidase domain-containing protein [Chloroflexota bacterium]